MYFLGDETINGFFSMLKIAFIFCIEKEDIFCDDYDILNIEQKK